jgi:NitT/TauT family transport system permease protein
VEVAGSIPRPGFARRAYDRSAPMLSAAPFVVGPLVVFALVVGLWEAGVWNDLFGLGSFILPKPSEIVQAFSQSGTTLASDLESSFKPAILGYGLGNGAGLLAGALLVVLPLALSRRLSGFFTAFQALPIIALAPLVALYIGSGLMYKATVVAVLAFPSMLVFSHRGMTHLHEDVYLLMDSYGASPHQVFLKVRLPNSLPFAFTALKYTTVLALVGVTVSEVLSSRSGLGYEISNSLQAFETPTAWAAVVILAGLGIAWYMLLGMLERLLVPWAAAHRRR